MALPAEVIGGHPPHGKIVDADIVDTLFAESSVDHHEGDVDGVQLPESAANILQRAKPWVDDTRPSVALLCTI